MLFPGAGPEQEGVRQAGWPYGAPAGGGKPVGGYFRHRRHRPRGPRRRPAQVALGGPAVSRGYAEEMEDFAYCVRMTGWRQSSAKEQEEAGG